MNSQKVLDGTCAATELHMSSEVRDEPTHTMCDLECLVDRLQLYDSSLTELQKKYNSQTLYVKILEHDLDSHKEALIDKLKQVEGYRMTLRTLEADFSRLNAEMEEKDGLLACLKHCHDYTQHHQCFMKPIGTKRKFNAMSTD